VCRRSGGTKKALQEQGIILSSIEKETNVIDWVQDFVHHRILVAGQRVEFVRDRMSNTV
jgi:hypothetical protein